MMSLKWLTMLHRHLLNTCSVNLLLYRKFRCSELLIDLRSALIASGSHKMTQLRRKMRQSRCMRCLSCE